ncbi:MAG: hypothetical protein Q9223_003605, partial [Gallowayella weberi]
LQSSTFSDAGGMEPTARETAALFGFYPSMASGQGIVEDVDPNTTNWPILEATTEFLPGSPSHGLDDMSMDDIEMLPSLGIEGAPSSPPFIDRRPAASQSEAQSQISSSDFEDSSEHEICSEHEAQRNRDIEHWRHNIEQTQLGETAQWSSEAMEVVPSLMDEVLQDWEEYQYGQEQPWTNTD